MRYSYGLALRHLFHAVQLRYCFTVLGKGLGFFPSLYQKAIGFCVLRWVVGKFPITRQTRHLPWNGA